MKRKQQTLESLLAPSVGAVQQPKRRERKLPAPKAAPGFALKVYRCQLVEERTISVKRLTVATPSQCAAVVWEYIDQPDCEVFVSLMLDRANTLLGVSTVAIGDHDQVFVSARQVYKPVLLLNADRVVVAHNHLNGDVRPSKADKQVTRMLVKAGRALGIQLCDHVIVGRTAAQSFSMLDAGLVPEEP